MAVTHPIRPLSRSALRELVFAACVADPCGEPIAPLGEHGYATLFRVIPSALAVLRVAAQVEPEAESLIDWYRYTTVAELGHLTPEQLVGMGRAPLLVAFLLAVRDGERG